MMPMIELQNVHVVFNQGTHLENHVLRGLDLKLDEGEFVTVIGSNGAGKSTLMNVLTGEIQVSSGDFFLDGNSLIELAPEQRSKKIARIFQNPLLGTFANLTIEENLSLALRRGCRRGRRLALDKKRRGEFKQALAKLDIGLENRLQDRVALLSGGQRQALSLIMATMQEAKLLLLDEPTAALDPKMAKTVLSLTKRIVEEKHLTTLMITHSMSQALEYGNRTLLLHQGRIEKDIMGTERRRLAVEDMLSYFV
ncbi:MAG: ATP-binding cassette domain-containing protein [Deltaproteobacteria bacterium]|nr:ATP-binding cassette domain-containing protein [Deltaproteobacteria bacterium]